jgi:hypothetical protein
MRTTRDHAQVIGGASSPQITCPKRFQHLIAPDCAFQELDVLDLEARGEGLPQLVGLLAVGHAKGVQVLGAAHLCGERGVDGGARGAKEQTKKTWE